MIVLIRRIAANAALVAALMASSATAQEAEQCLDPAICPIPYVRLSKQETEPFLFRGRPIVEDHPRYGQYRRALRRFPDVRSCLIEREYDAPRPDLRQIDWDATHKAVEIDVCTFRIFSSIEDKGQIKQWLVYHGFRLGNIEWTARTNYAPKPPNEPAAAITGYLTTDQFRKIIPRSWIASLIGFEGLRGYSLTIEFSTTGQVVGAYSGGGTIFN